MTINEILKKTIEQLKQVNIEDPNLKAKMLVSNVLKKGKEYLLVNGEEKLNVQQEGKINHGLKKLIEGVPIQYITNKQGFMGLDFYVDERVLIPQPDTETLVEEVIKISTNIESLKVLDLCTGSGTIGISLAKNITAKKIAASDISCRALDVAKINCKKHNIKKIELIESDLFKNIKEKFNIIVSNPPYIETGVIETLSKEVKNEPQIALDGGQDGLDFYRIIINEAYNFLEPNGYLCLEIGYNQKDKVINIINNSGKYKNIYSKKDLADNDRVVVCQSIDKLQFNN